MLFAVLLPTLLVCFFETWYLSSYRNFLSYPFSWREEDQHNRKKSNFQRFFVRWQMLVLKTMESIPSTQSESFIEGALLNQPSLFKKFLFAVAVFEGILDFRFQHFNLGRILAWTFCQLFGSTAVFLSTTSRGF